MRILGLFLLTTIVGLLAGCAFRFGPGLSMKSSGLFSEPPHIVAKPEGYSLRWRYATGCFFFEPESKAVKGQLLFALLATSSSGSMKGQYRELPITDPKQIQALESGGAFWLEPDGEKVRLEVRR